MKPYESLVAWQRCHELTLLIYQISTRWPADERYGMTSQIRRATAFAAANITEGVAKRGHRELRRYLDISLGSLSEVGYFLRLARDLAMMSDTAWQEAESVRDAAGRMTWLLYRSITH